MPFTSSGHYIVGKSPIHTQLMLKDTKTGVVYYVPVKNFTWKKATDMVENLHSGSPLASDLVDGHHKYNLSFETGTWLTTEVNKENAMYWEFLAYNLLVRPHDSGRPRVFEVHHKQSTYYDDEDTEVGGKDILWFTGCKINDMGFSQGENGINKRTYSALARRMTYGNGQEESQRAQ
jgi:hypothetical protein